MIDVIIRLDSEHRITDCTLEGHAGYDAYGYDIVCAAISSLTCTTMLGLLQVTKTEGDYKAISGFGQFHVKDTSDEKGQALLETMVLGLTEIEKQYPKFIKIRTFRR